MMENVPKFERRRDGGTLTDSRQIADLCYHDETEGASDLGCSSTSSRVSGVHIIVPDAQTCCPDRRDNQSSNFGAEADQSQWTHK